MYPKLIALFTTFESYFLLLVLIKVANLIGKLVLLLIMLNLVLFLKVQKLEVRVLSILYLLVSNLHHIYLAFLALCYCCLYYKIKSRATYWLRLATCLKRLTKNVHNKKHVTYSKNIFKSILATTKLFQGIIHAWHSNHLWAQYKGRWTNNTYYYEEIILNLAVKGWPWIQNF